MKKKSLLFILLLAIFAPLAMNAQQSLPYSYGFENNDLAAAGWTTANPYNSNTSEFGIIATAAHDGSNGFRFSSYNRNNAGYDQYLFSPELTASNPIVMTFWYKASSSYGTEEFSVGYSNSDTDPDSFTWVDELSVSSTTWTESEEYTFPRGTKYVAIWYYSDYQYRLYVDDFSFEEALPCAKPENLVASTDGATATVTWDGTADNDFIIDINGISTPGVTSPYTFNVALSTTYDISVTANCGGDGLSTPATTSITTPPCIGGRIIEYSLTDSYGDGWNGASITFIEGCDQTSLTCSGSAASGTLTICGDYFAFIWNSGSYDSECGFTFTESGTTLFTKPSSLSDGQVLYRFGTTTPIPTGLTAGTPGIDAVDLTWTAGGDETAWQLCVNDDETNLIDVTDRPSYTLNSLTPDTDYTVKVRAYIDATLQSCWSDAETFTTAEACTKPTDLGEDNISYTTVDLSWTGTSDRYMVQYGTWTQAGTDHVATSSMTPYTFDLSGFSGKGTVAIRHYNVTDMFYLNVDDIIVKDANNTIVYSQDFEGGSIPSNMSNIDMDHDGNAWALANSSNMTVNGSYGVYSASWTSSTGPLTPDNWLVISDIQLGGSITFSAVGQDPSVPYENFAVYVIADNQFTEAYSGANTSCQLTGLTEGTPYVWRVKGVCEEYTSNWVSSMFKTKDDLLVFAIDGAWDRISNWTDADGNTVSALPLASNKVRIDANAIIADGVVATAKSVTLNGGSINIEEGGQLKQSGTVKVTMHKGITGYGAGNEEAADHFYFIATPHSCSYLEENDLFPYVLNVTDGNYDLYAFDQTADLEWINFKSEPDHSEFHTGSNTGLFNKKGYLYANETDSDLTFVGTVSASLNNTIEESFSYNENASYNCNGFKLVGNPFACNGYLTFTPASGQEPEEVNFYVMNADGDGYELSESSVALAPCTGAFFYADAAGTINFSSEDPATKAKTGMLNINLSHNGKVADMARVRFGEGMRLAKQSFRNNSSTLYFTENDKDYAVVYSEAVGEMPLNFKAETTGTYTISFKLDGANVGYLHLYDKITGKDVNILTTPEYSFVSSTADAADRFVVRFSETATNSVFAYQCGNDIIVNGNGELQVFDIMGRMVMNTTVNGVQTVSLPSNAVYIFRMVGETVNTQKIVVR